MKNRKLWNVAPATIAVFTLLFAFAGAAYFYNRTVFYIELGAAVVLLGVFLWSQTKRQRWIRRAVSHVADLLDESEQTALLSFPMPIVVSTERGEIVWYNDLFRSQVLLAQDVYGQPLTTVTGGAGVAEFSRGRAVEVEHKGRLYTAYVSVVDSAFQTKLYVLYYIENTKLKQVAQEYSLSRPAVVLFYIDNMDELLQNSRDSERAQVSGRVLTILEDWALSTSGLLRKYANDRFMLVLEQRDLQAIINNKFDILDRVRAVQTESHQFPTLSIGVGQGETLRESEKMARQALDMALGRGGDQAAVKTKNGYDFYGGVSRGVEKRTKVRTRVVASALLELIAGSDMVLLMGHRFSDLDCLGSGAALASAVRSLGKPAYAVVRRQQTLAAELLDHYKKAKKDDLFIEPYEALPLITRHTLLIITDTHNPKMLEAPDIYQAASTVVVIDHHRKMVDFVDNAVIFYHEPHASSASEMVTELLQYLGNCAVTRTDAEALLAGIMLDTRGFILRAGVRTFEAAAYLRKLGADTVEVKNLFAGDMELHKQKADIIAEATIYRHMAIAVKSGSGGSQQRIAAAQAADELLSIKEIEASFVVFSDGETVNISARSLGNVNVQLIMEALGGGGHLTMAGAQLENVSEQEAVKKLIAAIDQLTVERLQEPVDTDE